MKFNKLKKELNEINYSSNDQMRRNTKKLGDIDGSPTSLKLTMLKRAGANSEEIAKWRNAERRGVSFESFLLGLIQDIKDRPTEEDGTDFDKVARSNIRESWTGDESASNLEKINRICSGIDPYDFDNKEDFEKECFDKVMYSGENFDDLEVQELIYIYADEVWED